MVKGIRFQIQTPLGITVRTTEEYWEKITTIKHPSMKRFESKVTQVLEDPDQVRRSTQDANVHLYYKSIGKISLCIVVDCITEKEGYIITAYPTDRIKEGEQIYEKT